MNTATEITNKAIEGLVAFVEKEAKKAEQNLKKAEQLEYEINPPEPELGYRESVSWYFDLDEVTDMFGGLVVFAQPFDSSYEGDYSYPAPEYNEEDYLQDLLQGVQEPYVFPDDLWYNLVQEIIEELVAQYDEMLVRGFKDAYDNGDYESLARLTSYLQNFSAKDLISKTVNAANRAKGEWISAQFDAQALSGKTHHSVSTKAGEQLSNILADGIYKGLLEQPFEREDDADFIEIEIEVPVSKSIKTFNMRWVAETLDQVLAELSEPAVDSPELDAAVQSIIAAKRLVHAYSTRLLDTNAQKSAKQMTNVGVAGTINAITYYLTNILEDYNVFMDENSEAWNKMVKLFNVLVDEEEVPDDMLDELTKVFDGLTKGQTTFQAAINIIAELNDIRKKQRVYG